MTTLHNTPDSGICPAPERDPAAGALCGGERYAPRRPAEKGGEGETAAFRLANKMPPPRSTPALCPPRAGGMGPGPPPAPPPLHTSPLPRAGLGARDPVPLRPPHPLHAGPLPRGPLPCAGLLHLGVPTAPAENGRGGGGLSPPLPFWEGRRLLSSPPENGRGVGPPFSQARVVPEHIVWGSLVGSARKAQGGRASGGGQGDGSARRRSPPGPLDPRPGLRRAPPRRGETRPGVQSRPDRAGAARLPTKLERARREAGPRGTRTPVRAPWAGRGAACVPAPPTARTWLILPVVICLSQRLSHARVSTGLHTVKLRMAH